ncbi:hypothetical protein [Micromonospora parathelypteridis]|uniref:Uncharacterized protein n=1 Tax=Micromonospora parathelypteridis TaxID=1839617 RepID=A0A840VLS5_9ACTN|nr:hypothetical protein [Micromonospora parathelypteridis]MBB5477912.1 hypothetical protein [Micromonospora parathelypteridis]GGO12266.1 hypothetical protein GCM10011576_21520 [Micromonospora parathelypteridis]
MSPLHRAGADNGPPIGEIGRDDAYPLIRDERACIVTALRLGWWMADAYHHGQHAELGVPVGPRPAVPPAKLSNLTEMSAHRRMRMYLDGVDVALAQIAELTRHTGPVPDTSAARALLPDLARPDPADPVPLLLALDDLNVEVLRWAMATNHRVGLAYRLGRSVADTVRAGDSTQLLRQFGGRQIQISRWLDELASVLPPYSAAVVRRSLAAWATAVDRAGHGDPAEPAPAELSRALRGQGDLWRDVLTGGLHPRDLLDEEDYAVIARNLIIRDRRLVAQAARGIFWPVLVPLLLVLFAVVGVSAAAAAGSPTTRATVALVGLGAGLAAIWRSVSGPALAVAGEVNRPLLDSELTARMALRLNRPLTNARRSTVVAPRTRRQRHPEQPGGRSKYVAPLSRPDLP